MDELVIAGGLGKQIDAGLIDQQPVRYPEVGANERGSGLGGQHLHHQYLTVTLAPMRRG